MGEQILFVYGQSCSETKEAATSSYPMSGNVQCEGKLCLPCCEPPLSSNPAVGADAFAHVASDARTNTRRACMGTAGLCNSRPSSAPARFSQTQQEFRYADRLV